MEHAYVNPDDLMLVHAAYFQSRNDRQIIGSMREWLQDLRSTIRDSQVIIAETNGAIAYLDRLENGWSLPPN